MLTSAPRGRTSNCLARQLRRCGCTRAWRGWYTVEHCGGCTSLPTSFRVRSESQRPAPRRGQGIVVMLNALRLWATGSRKRETGVWRTMQSGEHLIASLIHTEQVLYCATYGDVFQHQLHQSNYGLRAAPLQPPCMRVVVAFAPDRATTDAGASAARTTWRTDELSRCGRDDCPKLHC
jgi:hypothetical protein